MQRKQRCLQITQRFEKYGYIIRGIWSQPCPLPPSAWLSDGRASASPERPKRGRVVAGLRLGLGDLKTIFYTAVSLGHA